MHFYFTGSCESDGIRSKNASGVIVCFTCSDAIHDIIIEQLRSSTTRNVLLN